MNRDFNITTVAEQDLPDLLPLLRAYCDFYETAPTDDALLALSRALIAAPDTDGVQLIARRDGVPAGFATIYWTWQSTQARRQAVMNDLFVAPEARGSGLADALIHECVARAREYGAGILEWQTATDNFRAQKVYDRVGGERSERWLDYSIEID